MKPSFIPLVLFTAGIVFISGCVQVTPPAPVPESLVISEVYYNGFCPGGCERNLTITSDGTVKYYDRTGDNYHEQKEGKITNEELLSLINLFETNNFFNLNERYDCENALTDGGGNTFYFKDDSREKRVWVYGGCELPSRLRPIYEKLNEIKDRLHNF